jgi:peptidoglycan/LPS O-acetylase OafA/YrhL
MAKILLRNSAQPPGFVDGIHGLRALAAILVVFYHSGGAIASDKYLAIKSIASITAGLDSGVDIFFGLSGFVISLPLFLGKSQKIGRYLVNRALRIYPIAILTAAFFLAAGWLVYDRVPDLNQLVSSILLFPSATEPTPVVLWTLKQELLFYTIFSLAFIRPVLGLSVVAAWAIIGIFIPDNGVLTHWFFNAHNVQFLFGILAAYVFVTCPIPAKVGPVLAAVSVLGILIASNYFKQIGINEDVSAILLGILAFGAIVGAASTRCPIPRVIMFLGTASYSIYLIHFFFVSITVKIIFKFTPAMPSGLAVLLVAIIATLAGSAYFLVFERPLEVARKRLMQRKYPSDKLRCPKSHE